MNIKCQSLTQTITLWRPGCGLDIGQLTFLNTELEPHSNIKIVSSDCKQFTLYLAAQIHVLRWLLVSVDKFIVLLFKLLTFTLFAFQEQNVRIREGRKNHRFVEAHVNTDRLCFFKIE